ncbi:uncharacterized protein [Petaurus breviceps papuanus]|uniref:uncharacterized protein n=1 Tax=Petaurus breviceps papuanus TaxID=3040969 RepID=UPI0036D7ED3F
MGAEHQARACLASCGPATPPALRELLRMLQRFAGASGRRCQERSLAEAGRLLPALRQTWAELGAPEAQPFLRCLLSCQLEALDSLGAFRKLEKILVTLASGKESMVSEEVARMLGSLTQGQQALTLGDLRTVCLFLEESSLAREHWRHALDPLLGSTASTLASVLQDPAAGSTEQACHAVKLALQLFQTMPEEVGVLVWSPAENVAPLASILQALVQVIMGKVTNKDARLLAGTALGMLVNTAPTLEVGARAVSELLGLLSPDHREQRLGGLRVAVPPMTPDALGHLVMSRGLLTSCRREILTFRSPRGEACLLLGDLMPPIGPGWSTKNMDYRASLLQAFSLWLRRVHESTPGIWTGRLLSGDSPKAQQLTHFIWSHTKSPLEGLAEVTLHSFSLFLELYGKECGHFGDDGEEPLFDEFLERVRALPWPTKARYPALCALLPFLGSGRVLAALPELPKNLLLCLSTNPLSPPAADTYRCFLQAQREEWVIAEAGASEGALAEQWARHWLPTLAEALQSPVAAVQGRAVSSLLPHTLRLFPASAQLLEKEFAGPGLACLRGWAALQKTQKELGQGPPAASQSPARLAACLACGDEAVRLAAASLLCGGPGSAQAPGPKELAAFQDFLWLNLSGGSASFRQLLQAAVIRLLGRLRDSALATLCSQGVAGSQPAQESLLLTGGSVSPRDRAVAGRQEMVWKPPGGLGRMTELLAPWQVSALHVLHALVRGAGLGAPMLEWAAQLLELCLGTLGSPCWAMRNASTQLFGSLTGRLLGQSLSREDSGSHKGLSPEAFFTLYPALEAVLLAPLLSSLGSMGESHLRPALHAVLTLLAKLQPGTEHLSSSTARFQECLLRLSESPVYAMRAMAARALVPFVPLVELEAVLLYLLRGLAEPGPHNTLHGQLLQACALLAQDGTCRAFQGLQTVVHQAEAAFWLLTPAQRCPLIRLAYLQLLSLMTSGCSKDFLRQVEAAVTQELGPSGPDTQVGASMLRQESARFLCREAGRLADPSRAQALGSLLRGSDPEVRQAVLAWVLEEGTRCKPVAGVLRALLLETLWPVLQDRGSPEGLKLHLEALVHLHEDPSSCTDQLPAAPAQACLEPLLCLVETPSVSPTLLGRALCALSLLLDLGPEDLPALGRWSLVLRCWSEPRACEELRLAAAQSLRLAGVRVVAGARAGSAPALEALALRLLNAGIFLLQDEDRAVRLEASVFASLLAQQMGAQPWEAGTTLQANQGLLLLLQVIGTHFGACEDTWPLLMLHLPQCDLEGLLEEVGASRPPSLYEEDGANFFAEPAVFAQVLLPFVLQLLDRAEDGAPLRVQAQQWAAVRAPEVLRSLRHCCVWWSQDDAGALFLKALGCPKVHTALAVLLVEAELLVRVLEAPQARGVMMPGASCSPQELRQTWGRARALLTQHGMAPQLKDSRRPGLDKRLHTLIDGPR